MPFFLSMLFFKLLFVKYCSCSFRLFIIAQLALMVALKYQSQIVVINLNCMQVRLVGRMLNKVERVTDVAFVLDDGTGRIDVNRWYDAL
jgi:hypothetical protein